MTELATPEIVDRATWERERDALLAREKAHTREGDALAAARRRLPMTPVPEEVHVTGPDGPVPLVDVFEGRRLLLAYFHMWHDGRPWAEQCPGCTINVAHLQTQEYLRSRGVTFAVFSEGTYAESAPFRDFMGYAWPWYSARDSGPGLLAGRDFGFLACYLRDDDGRVFETYWTGGRGVEAMITSYRLLDLTVYGRQEGWWEDSPAGWPQLRPADSWRLAGRPTAQWGRTREPVDGGPVPDL